ncbi:MAG: sugar phosphate isomerase/epimerase, partial [Planctomycetota bacterium]
MELAMHTWMRAEPIEAALARIAPLGYKSLEISGEPERHDTAEIRGLLKKYGIRCFGAVTIMQGERNLLSADPGARARSVQYIKECLTMVSELGGVEMSVVPATVGKITPDSTPENEWQWAIDSLQEAYDHGLKHGVQLGIEPINRFETYFLNRGDQAIALAEAVGPECGVCFDIFHMHMEESDVHAAIRRAGSRLIDFHVADNNRFAPGMGTIDWPSVIETLKSIGYDGPLSVEFCAPIDRTPANPHPEAIDPNP